MVDTAQASGTRAKWLAMADTGGQWHALSGLLWPTPQAYISARTNDFHKPAIQAAYLGAVSQTIDGVSYNDWQTTGWLRQFLDWGTEEKSASGTCDANDRGVDCRVKCKQSALVSQCGSEMPTPCITKDGTGFYDFDTSDRFYECLNQWRTMTTVTSNPKFYRLNDDNPNGEENAVLAPIEYVEIPFFNQVRPVVPCLYFLQVSVFAQPSLALGGRGRAGQARQK